MCECAVNDIPGALAGGPAAGLPHHLGAGPVVQLPGGPWDSWRGGICQVWRGRSPGEPSLAEIYTSPPLGMRPSIVYECLCYLLRKQTSWYLTDLRRKGGIPLTLQSYSTGQSNTNLTRDLCQCHVDFCLSDTGSPVSVLSILLTSGIVTTLKVFKLQIIQKHL